MMKAISYPLRNFVSGIVRPGWMPQMTFGWQELKREMQPLRIRWGWVLLLAVALVLAIGECGPAVSAVAALL